ncbi:MAG: GNAT family N-acetyltransferase [Candidatus Limnocylindria bacterium]
MRARLARPAEYEDVGELTVRAYRTVDPDLGDYADELRAVSAHATEAEVLVVELDSRLVGTVTYVPRPGALSEGADPDGAWIRFLAVDEGARGRGVGAALVGACLERARRDARARVLLHTTDRMLAAQRLYERLGFTRTPADDFEVEPAFWLRAYRYELR